MMIRAKKLALQVVIVVAVIFSGVGCASQKAYQAYTDAIVKANSYRTQPGIEQTFDSNGRLVAQKIIMMDQVVPVSQIKDSEWAIPIATALSLGVVGAGNWAITHELAGAVKATQPIINTTTSSGGHMVGGNMDTSTKTTVVETSTANTSTQGSGRE